MDNPFAVVVHVGPRGDRNYRAPGRCSMTIADDTERRSPGRGTWPGKTTKK